MSFYSIIGAILALLLLPVTTSNEELRSILAKSAGVYKDPVKRKGYEKVVFITACNHGYLNHLHNFKCFADELGLQFLIISMESQVHDYITNRTSMTSFLMNAGKFGEAAGASTGFRDKHFNLITAKKIEAVHDILVQGYDVIFSDLDVAILDDFLPHLLVQGADYVHSVNGPCEKTDAFSFTSKLEGNTGFYFVRSTPLTINLWKEVFEAAPKFPKLDDQAIFWKIIRQTKDILISPLGKCPMSTSTPPQMNRGVENSLTLCNLDTCVFSSGMLSRLWTPEFTYEELLTNLELRNQSLITAHANYIKGGNTAKMSKLRDHNMWLATKNIQTGQWDGECLPFKMLSKEEVIRNALDASLIK